MSQPFLLFAIEQQQKCPFPPCSRFSAADQPPLTSGSSAVHRLDTIVAAWGMTTAVSHPAWPASKLFAETIHHRGRVPRELLTLGLSRRYTFMPLAFVLRNSSTGNFFSGNRHHETEHRYSLRDVFLCETAFCDADFEKG